MSTEEKKVKIITLDANGHSERVLDIAALSPALFQPSYAIYVNGRSVTSFPVLQEVINNIPAQEEITILRALLLIGG